MTLQVFQSTDSVFFTFFKKIIHALVGNIEID
jgi:hypothetical protein